MAYIKGSYPALIGGVSQQVKIQRKPDQVERQVNMLSDPVTGPRRRGGYELTAVLPELSGKDFSTELITAGANSMLCAVCACGNLYIFAIQVEGKTPGEVLLHSQHPYLSADSSASFQFAKHGSDLLVLNREQVVSLGALESEKARNPKELGWFYVNQGGLAVKYDLTVRVGSDSYTVTHTTPESGAINATPEAVSTALQTALQGHASVGTSSGYTYTRRGPYVFVEAPVGVEIDISTPMSDGMMRCSANSTAPDTTKLPAKLPSVADGYIMQIGYRDTKQYFEWDFTDTAWKERAAWGQRYTIQNLPVQVNIEQMLTTELVGVARTAGDSNNSPDPHFIGRKLTGICSFQGRLVLLCNEYVCTSSSRDITRFYRASISGLQADDPIEMASTSDYGVEYRFGVSFAGDLLLLSKASQAVVSGKQTLTPQNAVISIAADYSMALHNVPALTGKSLIYGVAGTAGHSAIWEMVPSEFSERQLYAQNITEHLPSYLVGDIRQTAVMPGAGYILILDNSNTLKLHQYMWAGSEKVHSCFHEWTCPDTVHSLHAFQDSFWLVTSGESGDVRLERWRYEAKLPGVQASTDVPHLDRRFEVTCMDPALGVTVPEERFEQSDFDNSRVLLYGHTQYGTPYSFTPDSAEIVGTNWVLKSRYFEAAEYTIGLQYTSILQPSAPVLRDHYDAPILMERSVLHSLSVRVQDTGELGAYTQDRARQLQKYAYNPTRLYRWDIDAGRPLVSSETLQIPARLDLQSAEFWFEADGCYDMQIVALEYGYRHNRRTQRAIARAGTGAG